MKSSHKGPCLTLNCTLPFSNCSLFIVHCSLFIVHCSLFIVHCSEVKFVPMHTEPLRMPLVLRVGLLDPFPEAVAVVEFLEVRELVDDDVVHDMLGRQEDLGGEVEVAVEGAAPPAAVGIL